MKRFSRKTGGWASMRDVLSQSVLEIDPAPGSSTKWLTFHWALTVGQEIAAVSRVEALRAQTLYVGVADKEWAPSLKALDKRIIREFNRSTGQNLVKRLVFRENKKIERGVKVKSQQALRQQSVASAPANEGLVPEHGEKARDEGWRDVLQRLEKKFRITPVVLAAFLLFFIPNCATGSAYNQPVKVTSSKKYSYSTSVAKPARRIQVAPQLKKKKSPPHRDPMAYYHYLLGLRAEREWDFDTAIKHYRQVVEHDPKAKKFHLHLARLYLRSGRLDQVIKVCEDGLKLFPDNPELSLILADVLASRGEEDRALIHLKKITQNRGKPKAFLIAGLIHGHKKDLKQAEEMFVRLTLQQTSNALGHHLLGRIYAQAKKFPQAEKSLKKALSLAPNLLESRELLAWVLERSAKYDEAAEEYKILSRRDLDNKKFQDKYTQLNQTNDAGVPDAGDVGPLPEQGNIHVKLGVTFFERARYVEALEELRLALAEKEDDKLRMLIAKIYEIFQRYDKGISEVEAVRKRQPESVEIMLQIARLYHLNESTEKAIKVLQKAVQIEPEYDELYHSLSLAHLSQKQYHKSIGHIRKAIELNDKNVVYYFELGALLEQIGDIDAAIASMNQVLELEPKHSNAHNFVGYLYALKGQNLDKALGHLEKALAAQPKNGYFLDSLGWIYFKKGDGKRALAEIKKAMIYTSPDPVLYDHLGDVHFDLKNYERADKAWKISLRLTRRKVEEEAAGELPDLEALEEKIKKVDSLLKAGETVVGELPDPETPEENVQKIYDLPQGSF